MSANDVATRTAESKAMCEAFDLIDAMIGGTTAMRVARELYMPKRTLEDEKDYEARICNATLFPAYTETVKTLTGRVFAEPLTLGDDVTPWIEAEVLDNVDRQGRKLAVWARDWFKLGLHYGLVHVLVDSPKVILAEGETAPSQAEQIKQKIRPYYVAINPRRVLGWQTDANGELSQVRVQFCRIQQGEFFSSVVDQVHVYEPGKLTVYENDGAAWGKVGEPIMLGVKRIPIVTFYTNRTGLMEATPALLELAHLNAKHWSQQASNDSLIETASVPVMCTIGIDADNEIVIGARSAVCLPVGGDMKFVEHTGAAIGAGRDALNDLKEEMRQAGAKLVQKATDGGQTKTATESGEDNSRENSQLGDMVQAFEDAIADVLDLTAEWRGETDGGSIELSPNLDPEPPSDSMTVLSGMRAKGDISGETMFKEAQRRGILDEDIEWKDEQARLESEGPPLPPVAPGKTPAANDPPAPARSTKPTGAAA